MVPRFAMADVLLIELGYTLFGVCVAKVEKTFRVRPEDGSR